MKSRTRRRTRTRTRTRKHQPSSRGRGGNRNIRAVVTYERMNPPRYTYVVPGNTVPLESRIATFLRAQSPIQTEEIVWRGQTTFPMNANSWFSTSKKDTISRSYGGRHLFKIHLMPGVRRLDLYNYYAHQGIQDPRVEPSFKPWNLNMSDNYTEFEEVLVAGGGEFWKDPYQNKMGFQWVGTTPAMSFDGEQLDRHMDVYETFYFME